MAVLDQFIEYKIYLYLLLIGIPCLITFGTIGNTLSVIVLLKPKQRRCSISRILSALAVTDLCFLWIAGLIIWPRAAFGINVSDSSDFVCKCLTFMAASLAQISVLLIATISLTRLISVLLPHKFKSICSLRNINICITLIVSLCYLVNIHALVGLGLKEEGHCAQIEGIYNMFVVKMLVNLQTAFFILVPVAFVIGANILTGVRIAFRAIKPGVTNRSQKQQSFRTTKILTIVSICFLVSAIPVAVFYALYGGQQLTHGNDHHDAVILLFWGAASFAYMTNSAINFVLYFLFVSKFRKEVKHIFSCKKETSNMLLNRTTVRVHPARTIDII